MPFVRETTEAKVITNYTPALSIKANTKWYRRVWYSVSNPFTYIFLGYRRY